MDCFILSEHLIEVGNIEDIFAQPWPKLWPQVLSQKLLKVYGFEPRVRNYLLYASSSSQPMLWIFLKTLVNKILALIGHRYSVFLGVGVINRLFEDIFIHSLVVRISCVKWRKTYNHLISQYS